MNDQEAALVGYVVERQRIEQRITEIQLQLRNAGSKGNISAEGRARISEAQRKRWEGIRANSPAKAKPTGNKHRISEAGKKRIAEATRKRWAAYRAEKAKAARAGGV